MGMGLGVGQVKEVEWASGREQRTEDRRERVCRAQGPADSGVCCAEEWLEGWWRWGGGGDLGRGLGAPLQKEGSCS